VTRNTINIASLIIEKSGEQCDSDLYRIERNLFTQMRSAKVFVFNSADEFIIPTYTESSLEKDYLLSDFIQARSAVGGSVHEAFSLLEQHSKAVDIQTNQVTVENGEIVIICAGPACDGVLLKNLGNEGDLSLSGNVYQIIDNRGTAAVWNVDILQSRLPEAFKNAEGWKLILGEKEYTFVQNIFNADMYGIEIPESDTGNINEIRNACFVKEGGEQTYTLTLNRNNTAWGSVSGGGNYEAGKQVSISATANSGYRFVNWTKSGVIISTSSSYNYTMPSENVTLTANFEAATGDEVTIFVEVMYDPFAGAQSRNDIGYIRINGGEWKNSDTITVAIGTQISIEAAPATGFEFEYWLEATEAIENNPYTFQAQENAEYVAKFRSVQTQSYTITAQSSPTTGGQVRINSGPWGTNKTLEVNSGTVVTLEALETSGFSFEGWYDGNNRVSTNKLYQFNANSNKNYKANFSQSENPVIPGEMVEVKAGSFQMGNTRNDSEGEDWEKPVHTVNLTYDYWIGKYEVTFEEYDAYCDDTGQTKPGDEGWGRGKRPVLNVTWWNAINYCNWLSQKEGLPPAYNSNGSFIDESGQTTTDITKVKGYRLPTEAEWEYAARGGHKSTGDYKYAGSNNIDEVAWYWDNSNEDGRRKMQEVGLKKANELGLYDMSGNANEWCHDWWADNYYQNSPGTNPIGPNNGSYRVLRSGRDYLAIHARVANRYRYMPASIYYDLGFRLARSEGGDGPVQTYTLTLNRNNTAWGSVSGGGNYEVGEQVSISGTANSGYRFVNWTKNGEIIALRPITPTPCHRKM